MQITKLRLHLNSKCLLRISTSNVRLWSSNFFSTEIFFPQLQVLIKFSSFFHASSSTIASISIYFSIITKFHRRNKKSYLISLLKKRNTISLHLPQGHSTHQAHEKEGKDICNSHEIFNDEKMKVYLN